jgi:hypothetical protein
VEKEKMDVRGIVEVAKDVDTFIPSGWKELGNAKGDLNKDGLEDEVVVAENVDYKNEDGALCNNYCPRKLLVLLQEKNGGYKLSAESDKAILLADEGGIWGDPYEGIKIENGFFLISFYGGSNWRWADSYRFRFQDGGWFMIGATSFGHFAGDECVDDKIDYNFLTGKKQEIKSNKWDRYLDLSDAELAMPCVRKELWSDIVNNKLTNLNDFTATDFELQKF